MLKKLSALCLTLLISFWGGCYDETFNLTEAADLTEPKEYNSNQISFKYPKNWEISADSNTTAFHNIYMQTQGEAIVIYQSYPSDVAESLTTFSKDFSKKMTQTEIPMGEISQSELKTIPKVAGFEGIEETFDISIIGISVPHKRIFLSKKIADRQVFLIFQAAIEDQPQTLSGFNLIRDTLKESEGS